MRAFIFAIAVSLVAVLAGCNSQEGNRRVVNAPQQGQTPRTATPAPPTDSARRISAAELHDLWQKNEVLIVDTRNEPSFKQGHIKGSILIPANEFAARADELPKSKMIVTYCT